MLDNIVPKNKTTSLEIDLTDDQKEILTFLRKVYELKLLPESEMIKLASISHLSTYGPGEQIISEGQQEGTFGFIPISGVVSMHKTSTNGKILIVELLKEFDIFHLLLRLVDKHLPNQLSAKSLQRVQVIWMPTISFNEMLMRHPIIFKEIVAHLLLCLQCSYRLSRGLAHDRVDVRIAAILTSLAHKFKKPFGSTPNATINFTRQQLADLTGTTCESAIRVTRAMQREGFIDIGRPGIIKIIDAKALHDLSEM